MTVYVDDAKISYGRMLMSHMAADTLEELHGMARAIGVDRRHFQDKENRPHYDICQSKKRLALDRGAVEVSSKELVRRIRDVSK